MLTWNHLQEMKHSCRVGVFFRVMLIILENPFPSNYSAFIPNSAFTFQRDLRTAYTQHWSAGLQHQLRRANVKVEVGDLIREIAIYAERIDIAEETKRLTGHLEQFGDLISQPDYRPIGRTLDFVAQEMLREANTIASKSPDAATSRWTVEIKGAIDRIKEQSANVE